MPVDGRSVALPGFDSRVSGIYPTAPVHFPEMLFTETGGSQLLAGCL